jgi:hypothetical protein
MSYLYRLPDGSNDAPDVNGRHTATRNVMHSAELAARFPGCEDCGRIARSSCQVCGNMLAVSIGPFFHSYGNTEKYPNCELW